MGLAKAEIVHVREDRRKRFPGWMGRGGWEGCVNTLVRCVLF
jgi:hypothetical protein